MGKRAWMGATVGLVAVLAGCGTTLTAAGQQVRIVEQEPPDCQRLGAVQANATGGHGAEVNTETARIEIRNQAGEMGGNVVHLESEKEEGLVVKLAGVAFQCASAP